MDLNVYRLHILVYVFISIILLQITTQCSQEKTIDEAYTTARSGLVLRSEATTSSSKKALIPYASIVKIISSKGENITIAGKEGRWTEVKYNNIQGWVFGGFLDTNLPAKLNKKIKHIENNCYDFKAACYSSCLNPDDPEDEATCNASCLSEAPAKCQDSNE